MYDMFAESLEHARAYGDVFRPLEPVDYNEDQNCGNGGESPILMPRQNAVDNDEESDDTDCEGEIPIDQAGNVEIENRNCCNSPVVVQRQHTVDNDNDLESTDEENAIDQVGNDDIENRNCGNSPVVVHQNATNMHVVDEESGVFQNVSQIYGSDVETFYNDSETSIPAEEHDNSIESKDPLARVLLEKDVDAALNDIFDRNNEAENNTLDLLDSEVVEILPNGIRQITKDLGEECQMIFKVGGNAFMPQKSGYLVKLNDPISGNMAFKENVSMIQTN